MGVSFDGAEFDSSAREACESSAGNGRWFDGGNVDSCAGEPCESSKSGSIAAWGSIRQPAKKIVATRSNMAVFREADFVGAERPGANIGVTVDVEADGH